jgi:hypothetical protein
LRNRHNEKAINNKITTRTFIRGGMERKVRKECVKRKYNAHKRTTTMKDSQKE